MPRPAGVPEVQEMEEELGFFAAIAESAFARRRDGTLLFHPWGNRGRGYEIRSEREHRRLRREFAWILRIGILGVPVAACLFAGNGRLLPLLALAPFLSLALLVRLLWSTRRLVPSAERTGEEEAGARLAAALSPRRIASVRRFFLALGAVSFALFLAGYGAGALVACASAAVGSVAVPWILRSSRNRSGGRSR